MFDLFYPVDVLFFHKGLVQKQTQTDS